MKFLYNYFKKKALKYEIKRLQKISDCRVENKGKVAFRIPTIFLGKGKVILGNECVFGFFPSPCYFNAYNHIEARNEDSVIEIGDETIINNNASIVSNGAVISIGKKCCIGLNFQCSDSDFHGISAEDRRNEKAVINKNTTIGNDCFIGNNVIVLNGAHIGDRCVVAAGSVVTSSVPYADDVIIAGNPAKIIRRIEQNKYAFSSVLSPLTFSKKGDEKGWLIAFENNHNIPFDVKRVYYIFGTQPEVARGSHAHKKSKQVLVAVSGSVEIHCEKKDGSKSVHCLDSAEKGLLIEGMVWHTMENFSPDCVLLVLADDYYDESDYIRNYEQFLKMTEEGNL